MEVKAITTGISLISQIAYYSFNMFTNTALCLALNKAITFAHAHNFLMSYLALTGLDLQMSQNRMKGKSLWLIW